MHGPQAREGSWDEAYEAATAHIAGLFAAGRPIVGICAAGILIRSIAPQLASKLDEPPVVAVAEDGSAAVPLVGGHRGANVIARAIAEATGGVAAITTAGDLRLGLALDEPPPGWHIADPARVKPVAMALISGEPAVFVEEAGGGEWLRTGAIAWAADASARIVVTDRVAAPGAEALVYHPPVLALGLAVSAAAEPPMIAVLGTREPGVGRAPKAVAIVVSVDVKCAEPGIHALAEAIGVPARFFPAQRLLAETERLSRRSAAAYRAVGCWGLPRARRWPRPASTGVSSSANANRAVPPVRSRAPPGRST